MIIDADLMFSKDQAVTATAASAVVVDLGAAGDAIGQELTFHTMVTANFATLTSLTPKVQTSANNSDWEDVVSGPAIARAALLKGKDIFCVRVPQGLKRYVRLYYTVTGSNATTGKITAFASKDL